MGLYDHSQYVSMTMEFRCNLRCVHCMIEGTMDRLAPESDERFAAVLAENARSRRWQGLILTGSEITLRRDLPELARLAREAGFSHVRIQTHGMHLEREDYVRGLVAAGVDEYFVSVAGCDAESHDAITTIPGSFEKMMRGLELLDSIDGVTIISNTVVTTRSYRFLPSVVERLSHLRRLAQMELWVYFPMSETDEKDLVASHRDVVPYLRRAAALAKSLGRGVEIKNFPECLLGEDGGLLVNDQPRLLIDPAFWPEFMRNGFNQCVYRDRCRSQQCLGLNTAYVEKFGFEADLLSPLATTVAKEPNMPANAILAG
jgi:MoaA/NifB/PqqE/SkfB family radical SAM enzyme